MTLATTLNTPARCIELAMKDAGLLQHGDSVDSDYLAEHMGRLQDLINLWQTQGLKLWLQQDLPLTLVAGQATYTIGPGGDLNMAKPLRIIQATTVTTDGVSRPLMMISRDEWTRLSDRVTQGALNSVFVDKQQTQLNVNFWLTPDATAATDTVHLIAQYQATAFTGLTDTINFPQEWFLALRWGLADDICTGQPASIMARCANRASIYREALENWDVEDAATQFQPDFGAGSYLGGFR